MLVKLLKWFFLSFLLSLLPFGLSALTYQMHDIPMTGNNSISHFWEHGELCLISVTLVATGIGDVASSDMQRLKAIKIVVICLSLIFLIASTVWYTQITSCVVLNQPYSATFTREKTPYLLIFSVITGFACVLLSKET